jgi:hypothetical protein
MLVGYRDITTGLGEMIVVLDRCLVLHWSTRINDRLAEIACLD